MKHFELINSKLHLRSKVVLSALLQPFIFVLWSLGKNGFLGLCCRTVQSALPPGDDTVEHPACAIQLLLLRFLTLLHLYDTDSSSFSHFVDFVSDCVCLYTGAAANTVNFPTEGPIKVYLILSNLILKPKRGCSGSEDRVGLMALGTSNVNLPVGISSSDRKISGAFHTLRWLGKR